jgi:hypothetical protein
MNSMLPSPTKDTLRLSLAICNHLDLGVHQVDIVATFLHTFVEELIYAYPPEGSNIPMGKVLRLLKSLYGLRQSPRCFNKALNKWLLEQGLIPSSADPCLYIRKNR